MQCTPAPADEGFLSLCHVGLHHRRSRRACTIQAAAHTGREDEACPHHRDAGRDGDERCARMRNMAGKGYRARPLAAGLLSDALTALQRADYCATLRPGTVECEECWLAHQYFRTQKVSTPTWLCQSPLPCTTSYVPCSTISALMRPVLTLCTKKLCLA